MVRKDHNPLFLMKYGRSRNLAQLVVLSAALSPVSLMADAIVRTQAMMATTIAEFFVENDGVWLELEIGLSDLEGFGNLMPDEIYERLGNEPQALRDRLPRFFQADLPVVVEDGQPIIGRIVEMQPRSRVKRDEITGEPLPDTEEDPEVVVFARIHYPFSGRPETLSFGMNQPASIGFVAYHRKVPVNDFRYLGSVQRLQLDWDDPWYSSFDIRTLRRTYFAPMSGFIYVEPYEVRKEIIVRAKTLQYWIDLGLEGRETIPVDMQDELKRKAAEFLRRRQKVVIDGEEIEPDLARINFLERTLKTSGVIDPPVELDVNSAILGVIFVYPTVEPLPQNVTMEWDLFNEEVQMIPAASVDQAGALPTYLEPDFAVLEWQNFLRFPELPTLRAIQPPPTILEKAAFNLRWFLAIVAAWSVWWAWRRVASDRSKVVLSLVVLVPLLGVTAGSFWFGQHGKPSGNVSMEIVAGLLHNVYRAFDFRAEEDIYDVLAQSIDGDLLATVYLETRRGLELENQGGARAKVKEIEMIELSTRSGENGGFIANATWNVDGSVGHWGHIHQRKNRYQAELIIQPVDGAWKLTNLEILQEERL